jgi:hypothetical protein
LAVDHALRERLGNVANAGKGYRNEVLNSEAWYLSRFIGKGFDAAQLTEWLVRAALRNGMGEREALRTINSALTDSATK